MRLKHLAGFAHGWRCERIGKDKQALGQSREHTSLVLSGQAFCRTLSLLAVLLWNTAIVPPTYAQIILEGPNVSGTVGLNGETFGSGSVYFYWSGGNIQTQLVNGDTDFGVRVEPDKLINANVYMYSFQSVTNANVYQYLRNISGPASNATEPLNLNFTRDAGRIIGRVSVTGGTVTRVAVSASKSISSNESYYGDATATGAPFDAILPFVAAPGVTVQGSATLRANAGCDVPRHTNITDSQCSHKRFCDRDVEFRSVH